ncbi:MAG: hypothetical protein E7619_08340 [Ruminococcaceae bacterium]|nr:hypothetical protein [Oscillospiraceae bacterium]
MKRSISIVLLLALCISVFAACGTPTETVDPLESAKDYIYNTYKNASEVYIADYKVIGQILVGDKTFSVDWATDASEENVKLVKGADNMYTVDINEKNPEEVTYTLTATVKDENGKTVSVSFTRRTPAAIIIDEGMSYEQIVEAAYKLEAGITMDGEYRLYGKIVKIDTPWSDQYKNITVTIQVGELADKPMMCYRLAGEGADKLAVGDMITVEGKIKNYNGTIEFDAGCQLLSVGYEKKDQSAILEAAYKLEDGLSMTEPTTLTGVINKIDTPWSDQYKNITVTIICDGDEAHPMMCYRLAGEGADKLAIGDTITVTGTIKNYKGTIEFDAGCTLDNVIKNEAPAPVAPEDPAEIVKAAFELAEGASLPYTCELTGTVASIDTPYSEQYGNITVTIAVNDKAIQCYRLKGDAAATLAVGDQIIVKGNITNYKGAVQFGAGCEIVAKISLLPEDIVKAAFELAEGASMSYSVELKGEVVSIDTPYSEQYKNVTVTIKVADKNIQCYRLKGEGADKLAVGAMITVKGTLTNYKGTVQFGSGCEIVVEG